MRRAGLGTFLFFGLLLVFPIFVTSTYGHGTQNGPPGYGRLRIDNEQFSDNQVNTGESVTIEGTIVNIRNEQQELVPYFSVTYTHFRGPDGLLIDSRPWYTGWVDLIYPPHMEPTSWYFSMEHSLPNPLILEPGGAREYEIRLFPLKAGAYHIHSNFISEEGQAFSRGMTVIVTGSADPTIGEITQLYLPLAIAASSLATLSIITARRTRGSIVKEKAIRYFFVTKASFETLWLTGVTVWLVAVAPSYLYPLEQTLALLVALAIGLGAITFGSYISVISRLGVRQRTFAIGTTGGTVALYVVLSILGLGDPYGQYYTQFDSDSFKDIAIVANVAACFFISFVTIQGMRVSARRVGSH